MRYKLRISVCGQCNIIIVITLIDVDFYLYTYVNLEILRNLQALLVKQLKIFVVRTKTSNEAKMLTSRLGMHKRIEVQLLTSVWKVPVNYLVDEVFSEIKMFI